MKDIKTAFIPDKVVVGRAKKSSIPDLAYLTCKYKKTKWVGESIFTRITGGFKPHLQRDSSVELKKAIQNSVDVIDNVPTRGFSFVSHCANVYNMNEFYRLYNVVLRDPRGFSFAISTSEFFKLLDLAGGNLENGALNNIECVYVWNDYSSRPALMATSEAEYDISKKASEAILNYKDNTKFLTPSKLVEGKIYKGSDTMPGLWMYLGKRDVYSARCHYVAIAEQSYDVFDALASSITDETGRGRYIFYNLQSKESHSPFEVKAGIAKCLEAEVDVNPENYQMFNKDGACSYAKLSEFVDTCPRFNKIDFTKSFVSSEVLSKDMFEKFFRRMKYDDIENEGMIWPFRGYDVPNGMQSSHYRTVIEIKTVDNSMARFSTPKMVSITRALLADEGQSSYYCYSSRRTGQTFNICPDNDSLYDVIQPATSNIFYENGKKMPQHYAIFFLGKEYQYDRSHYNI